MNVGPASNFFSIFMIIQIVMLISIVIGYVFMIVSIWRISKAHQSLAEALKVIAENLKVKQS